jgi:hypothetical protein
MPEDGFVWISSTVGTVAGDRLGLSSEEDPIRISITCVRSAVKELAKDELLPLPLVG